MAAHDTCNSSLSKDGKQQGQNLVSTVKQALLCVLYRGDTSSSHDLLADVFHQAPQLMAALCPTSRVALSRQFRKVVHSIAAVLGVQSFNNIAAIAKDKWPQLCLITVPFQAVYWQVVWLLNNDQGLLAQVSLIQNDIHTTALIVAPRTDPQPMRFLTALHRKHLTKAFGHLQRLFSRTLSKLHVVSSICDTETVAQIAAADWPNLSELNIFSYSSSSSIDAATVACLTQGNWPFLRSLHLRCNTLAVAAMKLLVQGKWPQLDRLSLKHTSLRDETVIGVLVETDNWPMLTYLDLCGVTLGSNEINWANRSCLTHLRLQH